MASCRDCTVNYSQKIAGKISKGKESPEKVTCNQCGVTKSKSYFRQRRLDYGGEYYSTCLVCWANRKDRVSLEKTNTDNLSEEGLDFTKILHFKRAGSNSWTYAEALKLMHSLILEADKGVLKINEIFAKYAPNRKPSGCRAIRTEIILAIEEAQAKGVKFNLKEYWEGGRQFSTKAAKEKVVWRKNGKGKN